MNNREAIGRVQSLYNKGVKSDDSRLSNRLVYSALVSCRGSLITQKYKKNQFLPISTYQTLPCIELTKVESHDCPQILHTNSYILKSKYPLPDLLSDMDKHILSITSLDGTITYPSTTFKGKRYDSFSKYTSKMPKAYIMPNKHLYITNTLQTDAVTSIGLFKNPIEADIFPALCMITSCKSYLDYNFPIDGDLETTCFQMAASELINNFKKAEADVQNNSRDDSK